MESSRVSCIVALLFNTVDQNQKRDPTPMAKLTLDLHALYNQHNAIEAALQDLIAQAVQRKIRLVEIIHGKGSGQLKKRVLRFLDQPEIKAQYHRVDKDSKNHGRLFVHFRF